jgi:hypothetical protein
MSVGLWHRIRIEIYEKARMQQHMTHDPNMSVIGNLPIMRSTLDLRASAAAFASRAIGSCTTLIH